MSPSHKQFRVRSLGWSCSRTVPPKIRPSVTPRRAFPGQTALERRSNTEPGRRPAVPRGASPTITKCFPRLSSSQEKTLGGARRSF